MRGSLLSGTGFREGEAPAEPQMSNRLGRSLALPPFQGLLERHQADGAAFQSGHYSLSVWLCNWRLEEKLPCQGPDRKGGGGLPLPYGRGSERRSGSERQANPGRSLM